MEDVLKKLDPNKQEKNWMLVLRNREVGTEDEVASFADQKSAYKALKTINRYLGGKNKIWFWVRRIVLFVLAAFGVYALILWALLQLQYALQVEQANMLPPPSQTEQIQPAPIPDSTQSIPAEDYFNQQNAE